LSAKNLILITRPIEDAKNFAALLEQEGFKALIEPLMTMKPVKHRPPETREYDGLLFTSANGVRLFEGRTTGRTPAFCLNGQTAIEARNRGFRKIVPCGKSAEGMANYFKMRKPGKYLYIRGNDVAYPMLDELMAAGSSLDELIVYEAVAASNFSPATIRAIQDGTIQAVTLFSKRTAETFTRLAEKHDLLKHLSGIKALSISDAVLKSVQAYGWAGAYAAERPDAAGMATLIKTICQKT
jgi:uroporphyrinogen-III synthase